MAKFSKTDRKNTGKKTNFSFSNSDFKKLVLQTSKYQGLFGKHLNGGIFHLSLMGYKSLWEKEKMLDFLLFNNVFLPFQGG